MGVQRPEDDPVLGKRHPAVMGNEAHERADVLGDLPVVLPQEPAGGGVDGLHPVEAQGGGGREHDAVVDDRRRLLIAERASGKDPLRDQLLDVAGIDLVEGTEAPARVGPVVHQPVGAVAAGIQQPIIGDVSPLGGRRRPGWQHERQESECGKDESHE